ncbi:MAG: helix-turn-helix domain-containing protein [Acidobacteriota bacterium]
MRIHVLAVPSVFDSAFFILRDTLLTALRFAGDSRVSVEVSTLDGNPIRSAGGQTIEPDRAAARARPNLVVLPGFSVGDEVDQVVTYVESPESREIVHWLTRQHERGAAMATGCTGAWLLAEAGVLDDREATTTWYLAEEFRRRYPKVRLVENKMLTRDDGVLCSGAAMAHMDLALSIVGQAFGAETSRKVAAALLLDSRESQAHFMITDFLTDRSDDVRRADEWIRENLSKPILITDLARAVHVSVRTLTRRMKDATGLAPMQFVQRVRAEEALRLLKTTSLPVSTIAQRLGYGDSATLRRLLKRLLDRTPSEFR